MTDIFEDMAASGAHRVLMLRDPASGLRAIIALDDVTLGPACGGIRTRAYPAIRDALNDAHKLAAAMTLKCAIAGLPAGGGKTVVIDSPRMDRAAAFRSLGRTIADLGGLYRAAGDLGTTIEDLRHAAEASDYVDTSGAQLGEATGTGIVNCIRAAAAERSIDRLAGLTVAVQGCGLIGAGVATALAAEGARLVVADVDAARADAVAAALGGRAVGADAILTVEADILSPCAIGGILTAQIVPAIRAWAICGGANNQLASAAAGTALAERGIAYVPDFLASSGAVIDGIARSVMRTAPAPLIDRLYDTARHVLARARAERRPAAEIGEEIARDRIRAAV